jgi:hypothetical protein
MKNAVVDYADAQTGKYAFTADVDGDYKFCFQDVPRPGAYINWCTSFFSPSINFSVHSAQHRNEISDFCRSFASKMSHCNCTFALYTDLHTDF